MRLLNRVVQLHIRLINNVVHLIGHTLELGDFLTFSLYDPFDNLRLFSCTVAFITNGVDRGLDQFCQPVLVTVHLLDVFLIRATRAARARNFLKNRHYPSPPCSYSLATE